MYIIWDKFDDAPYDRFGYGHFKIYATKKAAQRYIYTHGSTARCEVREVSQVSFSDGGFI